METYLRIALMFLISLTIMLVGVFANVDSGTNKDRERRGFEGMCIPLTTLLSVETCYAYYLQLHNIFTLTYISWSSKINECKCVTVAVFMEDTLS